MTDAPDLQPLPENVDGHVLQSYEHQLHHEIPWGQVAIGVGLVAVAYVLYQHLDTSNDRTADESGELEAESSEFVPVEVGGGGLLA